MNTFRKGLDTLLGGVCSLVLAIMVGIACWQVISRYILGVPSTITEETLRFLLVWVSMLGMAYVAGQKQHISLTLLLDKVSPGLRGWWDIILQVIFIAFSIWVLIIGGLKISAISMLQISPALGIPMGKIYYALPCAGVLIILYSVLNIVESLKAIRSTTDASEPTLEKSHD
ncbi:TRAP transporter small permease [Citrobacter amalonaticus]|uniref:TRAP transporter small permease protein n=1 Tax=Citrobacter amalonaticus TaxID=35703 RepID=A0A2S4RS90_CITAM|nr:TRAP transporter small permease [Citrobacter amalonaticus]POT54857.1 TRAP transporter small permease [Citrobacter amalonaticus]POT70831.1 TRAP transporter small permease [Citrobacter amalonaticus]POU62448.1 TRAP transporter small permease [Citrobacter amalonaticus]POV02886.1 TRAP transporter small permease [Citrobacter amalonaticus]